jgi:hypothetical protein
VVVRRTRIICSAHAKVLGSIPSGGIKNIPLVQHMWMQNFLLHVSRDLRGSCFLLSFFLSFFKAAKRESLATLTPIAVVFLRGIEETQASDARSSLC